MGAGRRPAALTRRFALWSGAALGGSSCFRLARPAEPDEGLSDEAAQLVRKAWAGVDPNQMVDTHAHIVGLGTGGTGCWVNPNMQSPLRHPLNALRFDIYKRAAGVEDDAQADQQYVQVLVARLRSQSMRGRALILAFDRAYDESGEVSLERSEFYTPNDHVLAVARAHPDLFLPCVSIHPYRRDAIDELERCVALGAVAVKWLPNAMCMDPSSARCDAFYRALERYQLPLLTHAGEEKAVEAEDSQRLGNPLLLRRALDRGVRVIVAHCASLGQNPDLDASPQTWVDNFTLFTRLMDSPQYQGQLFGEVSAMTQSNRAGPALHTVLARSDWHPRLLNGSDYPLPAINVVVQTRVLKRLGFITAAERAALNELDRHNPLLFDFVLKRTVASAGRRFSPGVFTGQGLFKRA